MHITAINEDVGSNCQHMDNGAFRVTNNKHTTASTLDGGKLDIISGVTMNSLIRDSKCNLDTEKTSCIEGSQKS